MSSALESLSPDDIKKVDNFILAAIKQFQEMEDIRGSLKDLAKGLADELGVKPKPLMTAARTAFKGDLAAKQEDMDTVNDLLSATGRGG